jgi:THO complex subunit 7
MAAIRAEHETQNRTIQAQKAALDEIITNLGSLRFMGKDRETLATSIDPSPRDSPSLEAVGDPTATAESGSVLPDKMEVEVEEGEEAVHNSVLPAEEAVEDDIEMGEVEEPKNKGKKKREEELEEGEASDASSVLSDPPDDDD